MQLVLAKIGLGDLEITDSEPRIENAQFDLLAGPARERGVEQRYPTDEQIALLRDPARLAQYDIVFLSCGSELVNFTRDLSTSLLYEPGVESALRQFVENGGRLYITDLEHAVIEHLWPEAIDFAGGLEDGLSTTREVPYAASSGDGHHVPVEGRVTNDALARWLQFNGLTSTDRIPIGGLVPGWTMIDRVAPSLSAWVEYDERPLTVSFALGCGRIVFSSYHVSEDYGPSVSSTPSAQEAALAFLIFQIGECVADPVLI
jgi:hypothetical protein